MDNKGINPQAIVSLKDALTKIYWYKNDLRDFLTSVLGNSPVLRGINWEDYKRNIVQQVIQKMAQNQVQYHQELISLMIAVTSMNDFSHLEAIDDGKQKTLEAKRAVQVLRNYTIGHEFISTERKLAEERRQAHARRTQ
jgi:hypothetical protein